MPGSRQTYLPLQDHREHSPSRRRLPNACRHREAGRSPKRPIYRAPFRPRSLPRPAQAEHGSRPSSLSMSKPLAFAAWYDEKARRGGPSWFLGAEGGIRTPTVLRSPAPQAGASASSATSARRASVELAILSARAARANGLDPAAPGLRSRRAARRAGRAGYWAPAPRAPASRPAGSPAAPAPLTTDDPPPRCQMHAERQSRPA